MCALNPPSGDGLTPPREKGIHNARAVFTLYALHEGNLHACFFSRLANDDFKYVAPRQVKQVGMLVGIEGGSPLFDKQRRKFANRNLTRAQIRIQPEWGWGVGGWGRTDGRTDKRKRVSHGERSLVDSVNRSGKNGSPV